MRNPLGRYRDAIFFASGFAGLIYESIWTHYLKLFLGHAAYAQTLVLAIFMGGMAIGAGLAARYTANARNPLLIYAGIEATIGVLALVFHPLFVAVTGGFYDVTFSNHVDGATFAAGKWGLASLLILPQSILLGATFPVFTSAATRAAPATEGRSIATLYFANSLGGAVGVIASGFVLIPAIGLPGTIGTAGTVNLAIAALVWLMSRAPPARTIEVPPVVAARPAARGVAVSKPKPKPKPVAIEPRFGSTVTLLLAVSFLTGASSFIYEIGWIRMLSLVLGSATHSFELMLSSFIFGLALGGLWIRKRIDSAANPGILLGYIQVAMGCAAVATIPLHNAAFDLVAFVVTESPKTDTGYAIFNLVRYGVASLIMFPAAFCAGMTLPLATQILYARKDQGERAIGLVYSANTVGAITGLGFAVHFGLPVIGLNYLVATGALIDVLLGIALVSAFGDRLRTLRAAAALVLATAGAVAAAMTFDPQKLASGAFRTGSANANGVVLEIAHGKTATISVEKNVEFLEIKTNGKPDASANLDPTRPYSPDEVTERLSAIYPLMVHAGPARIANIGFGSGLTGATLLMDPRVKQLDTIEIEPKVIDLARHFGALNRSAYTDARSAIHIDDAKSFFASNGKTYDIIISEPSNPWVSGVAGLFSTEFYHHVVRYLNPDGLFAQWLQIYEMNSERAVSVLKALDEAFDDYLVIALDWGDILLIGKAHGKVTMPQGAFAILSPELKATLRGIEVANRSDLTFRVLGNKAMFRPWLAARRAPANSDYYPYLDVNADRDRFLRNGWPELYSLALAAYPISDILGGRLPLETPSALTYNGHFGPVSPQLAAREAYEALFGPMRGPNTVPLPANLPRNLALQGEEILDLCSEPPSDDLPNPVSRIAAVVLPHLSSPEGGQVLWAMDQSKCLRELSGTQTEWRTLLTHIAARNARGIGESAEQLLKNDMGSNAFRTRYLLEMGMLGLIGAGERARAQALWETYSKTAFGDKPPDLISEILLAHARSVAPAP